MANIKDAAESLDTKLHQLGYIGLSLPIELSTLEEFYNTYGNQIFHIAAEYNYFHVAFSLIQYKLGDCTVENSKGMSPLMIAISHEHFNVAKIFYNKCLPAMSPVPPLLHLMDLLHFSEPYSISRREDDKLLVRLMNQFAKDFVLKLRREKCSSELIGKVLAKVTDFKPYIVINLRDPVITESFFQSVSRHINLDMTFETVGNDLKHTLIILRNAPRNIWCRLLCKYVMDNICHLHKSRSGRKYLRGIFTVEIFNDEEILKCLDEKLRKTEKKNLEIFFKYNLQSIIKANSGRDILASLFRDSNVSSYLSDDQIDVDGRGFNGKTPLHFASDSNSVENVRMLLNRGADPNVIDNNGQTPLSLAIFNEKCFELLLAYGSNSLFIIDRVKEIISCTSYSYNTSFIIVKELIIAQVIIEQALGKKNREYEKLLILLKNDESKKYIEKCRKQLVEFKMHKIRGTEICNFDFSIFTILTERIGIVARYIRKDDLLATKTFVECNEKELILYYRNLLAIRVEDIIRMQFCREKALQIVGHFIGTPDPHNLVVNKIVDYLDDRDLRKLSVMENLDVPTEFCKLERFLKLAQQCIPRIFVKS